MFLRMYYRVHTITSVLFVFTLSPFLCGTSCHSTIVLCYCLSEFASFDKSTEYGSSHKSTFVQFRLAHLTLTQTEHGSVLTPGVNLV